MRKKKQARFTGPKTEQRRMVTSLRRVFSRAVPRRGHVPRRMQQRALGEDLIALTLAYGHTVRRDRDVTILRVDRRARRTMERELGLSPKELDRVEGVEVVVGHDGWVRTVYRAKDYCRRGRRGSRRGRN